MKLEIPRVPETRPHAVVIGSGFGGLAAAVRLGARGYRVTVCERLDRPGGRASVFRQDGYTFDAGPTIVTAPHLFEELWTLAGARMADDIELRALDPFYTMVFDDGDALDCVAGEAPMRALVAQRFPGDLEGYDRFMAHSRGLCEKGFEELGDQPFGRVADMARVLPDLLRLEAWRSVHGLVARYVRDPRLRFALSFHPLFVGGNPFTAPAIYALIAHLERQWGVHYVMGGTGRLASGLAGLVERQGGTLRFHAEVARIRTSGARATGVELVDGTVLPAEIVVSNADAAWTHGKLLDRSPRWGPSRLARMRHSMSLFVWYFGTRVKYPQVPHHTILLGPRYEGLVHDIFERRVLADDFSLYLHRPTATDPSLAPEGCDAFYVLSPVPNLDDGTDWARRAQSYRQAIERRLEERMLPGLAANVTTSRVMTPLDFRDRYLATKGAAFGPEPLLTQSAWFRPHNAVEGFDNVYLVGAGTHPGAGLPGVLCSARILDRMVPAAHARA